MSNSIFIVDEVNELGSHSVNSLLTAFGPLLPTCASASLTSSMVICMPNSLLAPCTA